MGLLPLDEIRPLLTCPVCRGPLLDEADGLRCARPDCGPGGSRLFRSVEGRPILVDFERSVLSEAALLGTAGASAVPRHASTGRLGWLRALNTLPNRVAERHARWLLASLRSRGRRPRVLVVGGGTVGNGASTLYRDPETDLIAFDLYVSPWVQFVADAHAIPLADASVDAVWIQAVLEHVLDPARVVGEIERVLRAEGLVYAETPFLQQVHEGAYDFTRFTESGQRWLFRRFERIESGVVAGPGTQLLWSADHAVRSFLRSATAGRAVRLALFWMQWLDRLASPRFASDDASCVYFLGRRWDRELKPGEIAGEYRGAQAGR